MHTCPACALFLASIFHVVRHHAICVRWVRRLTWHARLQLRKISDLNDMFANEMVDVLGVIDTAQDSAIIQTKDGRDVSLTSPAHPCLRIQGLGFRVFSNS